MLIFLLVIIILCALVQSDIGVIRQVREEEVVDDDRWMDDGINWDGESDE